MITKEELDALGEKAQRLATMYADNRATRERLIDATADLIAEIDITADRDRLHLVRRFVELEPWSGTGQKDLRDQILAAIEEADRRLVGGRDV